MAQVANKSGRTSLAELMKKMDVVKQESTEMIQV
jgi:hypothetical protein